VIARRAFGLAALLLGLAVGAHLGPRADPAAAAAFSPAPDAPPPAPGADFSAIAQRVTPSVVNISALQVVRAERSPFYSDPFFREFIGGDIPFRMPLEERKTSLGSGVAVGAEGLVVTNSHVIERARQVTVTTIDRRTEIELGIVREGRRRSVRIPVEEARPDA
jgi:S1-C subfamily serine protease